MENKLKGNMIYLGLLVSLLIGIALGSRNIGPLASVLGASEVVNIRSSRAVGQITGQATLESLRTTIPHGLSIDGDLNMLGHGIYNISSLLGTSPIRINSPLVINGSLNLTGELNIQGQNVMSLCRDILIFKNNFTIEAVGGSIVFKKSGEKIMELTENGTLYLKGTIKHV